MENLATWPNINLNQDLFNLLVYMRLLKKILMRGPLRIEIEGTQMVMSVFENKI